MERLARWDCKQHHFYVCRMHSKVVKDVWVLMWYVKNFKNFTASPRTTGCCQGFVSVYKCSYIDFYVEMLISWCLFTRRGKHITVTLYTWNITIVDHNRNTLFCLLLIMTIDDILFVYIFSMALCIQMDFYNN